MRRYLTIRMAVVVVIAAIGYTYVHGKAAAAPVPATPIIDSFSQEDLDGDGSPDRAILMVDYAGNRYRVLAIDQSGDMRWSEDWSTGADFVNDVWLFQTEAGDQTKLIIRFSQDSTGYTAELFDDVDDDQTVSYSISNARQINITESPFPTLRVTSQQPWILPDGNINRLINITAYRPIVGSAVSEAMSYLPRDGRPALEQEVVDNDADGVADYQLISIFPDVPRDWGFFRTAITINIDKEPLPTLTDYFLWPYIGIAAPEMRQFNQRDPKDLSQSPILVDWQQGRIRGVTGFLPNPSTSNRWFFLSTIPLVKQKVNELDWEQFAFYNFAGSSTPDMILRLIRSGPAETIRAGQRILHLQKAAFSWHHTNIGTQQWDYKLELAGPQELPSTTANFRDFMLREVPYEDMLREYLSRQWAYATFVSAESNGYEDKEAMWEWGTIDGVILNISDPVSAVIPGSGQAWHDYLLGRTTNYPGRYYTNIREGFRGEFGEINGPGKLYFSPVDHKLHLINAQQGIWRLDDTSDIQYRNLNDDPYIDQWTFTEVIDGAQPLTVTKQLVAADNYLIYSDDGAVVIRQTSINPALFEAVPPRNHEEWEELGSRLNASISSFGSNDFLTMLRQFDGPEIHIQGAKVTNYRPYSDSGFRFVLELMPGYQVSGPDLLGLDTPEPGKYVVENNGRMFSVTPLVPVQLSLDVRQAAVGSTAPSLQITLDNTGSADALDLILVVEAESNNGSIIELARTTVQVLAGQTTRVPVNVPSTIATGSTLRIRQEDSQGQIIATGEWAPLTGSDITSPTAVFGILKAPILLPVVGMFAALVALAALIAFTRGREQPTL